MPSFEQSGFSESFNPAFDLVKSMAERQRAELEHAADARSERSLHGIKGWLASILVASGSLVAIGCDKAPEKAPLPMQGQQQVEHEDRFEKASREIDERMEEGRKQLEIKKQQDPSADHVEYQKHQGKVINPDLKDFIE